MRVANAVLQRGPKDSSILTVWSIGGPVARHPGDFKASILAAVVRLVKRRGAAHTTIDAVAREAGCAKGLVHYHFKTKPGLLAAAAEELGALRAKAWVSAFQAPTPNTAIEQTWHLLNREVSEGTVRAWISLSAERNSLTVRAVKLQSEHLAADLSVAAREFLEQLDLRPSVPAIELGWLLAGVVHGMGMQLEAGAPPSTLQGAYAAAWVGVLALGR